MSDNKAPEDQQEDSSDLFQVNQRNFTDAVVTATDWTTQTVLSQLEKGNIELNPDFQRRDAWKQSRKSKFIESLILGIPVPQLVLAERKNKRNSFIVIDGKQRLLSLRQYCSDQNDQTYKPFSLRSLDIRKDLDGVRYFQLLEDSKYQQDITNFENQPIRTVVIRNWPNEQFLYQVFLRLNTGSVPLSPQELRQALHPGPFSKFIDTFSVTSQEIRSILGLKAPDFRMRDAELVIRYYAFRNFLSDYKGNLSPLFDKTTEVLNGKWLIDPQPIERQATDLTHAIQSTTQIFGDSAFRKWNGESYERPLNRAIFDIMVLFFDKPSISSACIRYKLDVEAVFKDMCVNDAQFKSSIEGTTKSIDAIYTRISRWAEALNRIAPGHINQPRLENGRIIL